MLKGNMLCTPQKNRITWADVAKGIGILCIIAGHTSSICVRVVFTFHVPLFFLISGYFFSDKDSLKVFVSKKSKSLLIPYYFTVLLLLIFRILTDVLSGLFENILSDAFCIFLKACYASGSFENRNFFEIQPIGAIWFLYALFWAMLFVKLTYDKKHSCIYIVCIFLVSYFTSSYIWLPLSIQAGGTAALFVYIGMLCRKKEYNFEKINKLLMFLGFAVLIFEIYFNIQISIARNYFAYFIVSIIGSLFISYFVICLSVLIDKTNFLKKILCFYGENSLIILCFHLLEMECIRWDIISILFKDLNIPPTVQTALLLLLKILFCTLCTWITLNIKPLRKIFGK